MTRWTWNSAKSIDPLGGYWSWLLNKKGGHVQWTGILKSVYEVCPSLANAWLPVHPGLFILILIFEIHQFALGMKTQSSWILSRGGSDSLLPALHLSLLTATLSLPLPLGYVSFYQVRVSDHLLDGGFWWHALNLWDLSSPQKICRPRLEWIRGTSIHGICWVSQGGWVRSREQWGCASEGGQQGLPMPVSLPIPGQLGKRGQDTSLTQTHEVRVITCPSLQLLSLV